MPTTIRRDMSPTLKLDRITPAGSGTKERINKNSATGSVVKMIRIIEGLWRVCETEDFRSV